MPYISVQYSKSTRSYTFYTPYPPGGGHKIGEQVLVKDKNGFSLCKVVGYVPRPKFECNVVVASQHEMEEKAVDITSDKDFENIAEETGISSDGRVKGIDGGENV